MWEQGRDGAWRVSGCLYCSLAPSPCTLPPFLSPLAVPFPLPPAFLFLSGCQKTVCFWMPRLPHVSCSLVSSLVSRHSEAYVRVGARSCAPIPSGFWQTQTTETTFLTRNGPQRYRWCSSLIHIDISSFGPLFVRFSGVFAASVMPLAPGGVGWTQ